MLLNSVDKEKNRHTHTNLQFTDTHYRDASLSTNTYLQHTVNSEQILASFGICFVDTTTEEATTEVETTTQLTTTTTQKTTTTSPPPCVGALNRTDAALGEECGVQAVTGLCTVQHSACMQSNGDSTWKCQCARGYVRKKQQCVSLPKNLFFSQNSESVVITANTVLSYTIKQIDLTALKEFTYSTLEVSLDGRSAALFTYQIQSNDIKININQQIEDGYYELFTFIYTQIDGIDVKEFTLLKVTVSRGQLLSTDIVLMDGTPMGSIVGQTCTSCISNDDIISFLPLTDLIEVNIDGSIITSKTIDLNTINSHTTIASSSNIAILKNSKPFANLTFFIVRQQYSVSLPESSEFNTQVALLNGDHFDQIKTDGLARVNNAITLGSTILNYEDQTEIKKTLTLTIMGSAKHTLDISVGIDVEDVNDVSPTFSKTSYMFSTVRSSYVNVAIGVVNAVDPDSSNLQYIISPSDHLSVDQNGVVKIIKKITEHNYNATITVSDGKYSDSVLLTIDFLEPVETNLDHKFSGSISENSQVGVSILNASVEGYNDFHFTDQTAVSNFRIDRNTGIISSARSFDRENEADRQFKYTIVASDKQGSSCSLVVIGEVTITITDMNDEPPVFINEPYTAIVKENAIPGTLIKMNLPIATTDKDENSVIVYSLLDNTDKFSISATGVIRVAGSIDRESTSLIIVKISASDGVNSKETTVRVAVEDENDNSPVFTASSYSMTVQEDSSIGMSVFIIQATDNDLGKNALITYDMISDGGYFRINQTTGEITVTRVLDREELSFHTAVVYARDNGDPIRSASSTVTFNIADINDNAPVFALEELSVEFEEHKDCSNPILQVSATDKDEPNNANSRISFTILSGSEDFTIDQQSGQLSCKSHLDYESRTSFTVVVQATDQGSPPMSSNQTITVNVKDINDNDPTFIQPKTDLTIRYFTSTPRILDVLDVEDADSGENGRIRLSLTGTADTFLSIDNDGIIKTRSVTKPADNTYNLVVTATDHGSPKRSSTHSMTVIVSATATQSLTFRNQEIGFNVTENSVNGTNVGDLRSFVESPSGIVLQYEILDERTDQTFSVHGSTSMIKLKKEIDRERKDIYEFVVRVKNQDLATQSDLALIRIGILDINDNDPVFEQSRYFFRISEASSIGTTVSSTASGAASAIVATDADIGDNAVVVYRILESEGCASHFTIKDTNYLVLKDRIDYEQYPFCGLTLEASNPDKLRKSSAKVDIHVVDVNDNDPEILDDQGDVMTVYSMELPEDSTINTIIPRFGSINDKDSRENGDVHLSTDTPCWLDAFKEDSKIRLKVKTGVILDYEYGKIKQSCIITANDAGTPSRSVTATLNVDIMDVNDNSPIITTPEVKVDVARDVSVGAVIVNGIPASDADSGDNGQLLYRIRQSQDSSSFFIDPSTGNLTVNSPLFSVQSDEITLVVIVSDKGSPPLQSTAKIIITIKDENPRPYIEPSVITIAEHSQRPDGHLVQVNAFDRENGIVKKCDCTFRLDTTRDDIIIDSETGMIRFNDTHGSFDREVDGDNVFVTVIAKDKASIPKESKPVIIQIKITDINDQYPFFTKREYAFKVFQRAPDGTEIGTVSAIDKDKDPISHYSINITGSSFEPGVVSIDKLTGKITKTGNMTLNQMKNTEIKGWVEVQDSKDLTKHPDRAIITITIEFDDKNNNTPQFDKNVYNGDISWDAAVGHSIVQVVAVDNDPGTAGQVSYSIIKGNERGFFSIKSNGILSLAYPLDSSIGQSASEKVYLVIQATDGGIIAKYSTTNVTITISGNNPGQCVQGFEHSKQVRSLEDERQSWSAAVYVLVVLLCLAILASLGFLYKWRSASQDIECEQLDKGTKYKKYKDESVSYEGLGRPETVEYTHSNETFVPPTQSMAFDAPYTLPEERTSPPEEPEPDYDYTDVIHE